MVCLGIFYTAPPRHLLTIITCIGLMLAFCMRQVLPTTIQEMTLPIENRGPRLPKDDAPKYDWSELKQAVVLMGFYIGYSLSHFVTGPIVNKLGARGPMIIGMTISAAMTGLIPLISSLHWVGVLGLRIVTGAGQSVLLPGISSLLTYWVPLESRSTIAALIYTGVPMGTFFGIYCTAIVTAYWQNWHYAYYMWCGCTGAWLIFFMVYIYSNPTTHPRIDAQGSSYQRADFIRDEVIVLKLEKLAYACQTVATFGHTYILFTLDSYLPTYLNEALGYELEDYSFFAATPFASMYMCGIFSRLLFTWLVHKRNVNVDLLRLIYCSLCNVCAGGLLVLAFQYSFRHRICLLLIHAAAFCGGFFYGGMNMLDMSIRPTNNAMSLVNGLATTSGIAALTAIAIAVRNSSAEEWQRVSYVLLGVELVAWIFDCMFTMAKMCLLPPEDDKPWYRNIPKREHEEKMQAMRKIKEDLKRKQRGAQEDDQ